MKTYAFLNKNGLAWVYHCVLAYFICSSAICRHLPMTTMMFRRDSLPNKTARPSLDKPIAPIVSTATASKLGSFDVMQLNMNS
jgi:hypothetical protein